MSEIEGRAGKLFDRTGREIMRGDIVKVFHFIGARGKRHFMHKQCLGMATYPHGGTEYLFFSHLNFNDEIGSRDGPYHEAPDGRVMDGYEIVQSIDARFAERPRRSVQHAKAAP